jgi:hypothetical protein
VQRARSAAASGADEPPWEPPDEAELRAADFRGRVARLMRDYEPSYETDWTGYGYPGEGNDWDGYLSYSNSGEAAAAARRYHTEGLRAAAGLAYAEAREPAITSKLVKAREALTRTWPWQRRRRTELRELIGDAELDLWALAPEAEAHDFEAFCNQQLCIDAEWAAAVLGRGERAFAAASDAVASTLGWRPGDVLPVGRGIFRAGRDGIDAIPGRTTVRCGPAANAVGHEAQP